MYFVFVDYDLWKKYVPQPVSVKMGSVGEYYDILEELGRFVFDHCWSFLYVLVFAIDNYGIFFGRKNILNVYSLICPENIFFLMKWNIENTKIIFAFISIEYPILLYGYVY